MVGTGAGAGCSACMCVNNLCSSKAAVDLLSAQPEEPLVSPPFTALHQQPELKSNRSHWTVTVCLRHSLVT